MWLIRTYLTETWDDPLANNLRTETPKMAPPLAPPPKPSKLLAKMRANPKDDWDIQDFGTVCNQVGLTCTAPTRGTHYKISSPLLDGILLVPFKKPIKIPYVKQFLRLVEVHLTAAAGPEVNHD